MRRHESSLLRGMGRIEIDNERANQILAKINEAAHEQCPKCGVEHEHKAPVCAIRFSKSD